ncbi:hypothetical protein QTP86_023851 [Hemibagrus guttatus]|nr:hypothetical protein QTP86_023851 [Hemibagrus guttatus]
MKCFERQAFGAVHLKDGVITRYRFLLRENDCDIIWKAFEQAYVGRDPCDVPPEAYDPLINSVKQDVVCNTMLFWSKTKNTVKAFTDDRDCLDILEETLLGFLFDELTWCSKNESKETFTTDCPSWSHCPNNPVRSFWIRASVNFAATACGNVSAMLNGSLEAPFSSTRTNRTACDNPSLHSLQNTLPTKIAYNCREVPYSKVEGCISDPEIPCSDCL